MEAEAGISSDYWLHLGGCHSAEMSVERPAILHFAMEGQARGEVVLDVRVVAGPQDRKAGLFLCVARTGQAPNPEISDYHWVSDVAPVHSGGWQCRIVTQSWKRRTPAVVLVGLRRDPPPVPLWYPMFKGKGVEFELLDCPPMEAVSRVVVFEAKLSFKSEAAQLVHELRIAHSTFYALFDGVNGRKLSEAGMLQLGRPDDEQLAYGEVHFLSFVDMLQSLVAPVAGEIFVDLGSGAGRAVVAAALGFPELGRCIGFEIVPSLHEAAKQIAAKAFAAECRSAPITFHEADFLKSDWMSDADIVFVSSLCMSTETIAKIEQLSLQLKSGSRVITMEPDFGVGVDGFDSSSIPQGANKHLVDMSFGGALLHVVRRV